jgi:hypothetical protein
MNDARLQELKYQFRVSVFAVICYASIDAVNIWRIHYLGKLTVPAEHFLDIALPVFTIAAVLYMIYDGLLLLRYKRERKQRK